MLMITGETYEATRIRLHMSRPKVSAMSKRAGHRLAESAIKRLEAEGSDAAGTRGLSATAVAWLDYIYGLSDPTGLVDWNTVERGAPVLVLGEKGTYAFHAVKEKVVTVWGGIRNRERFHRLPTDAVRLIALTTLPPVETARIFESRYRGIDASYGNTILRHMRENGGAHSVGGLAYTLGFDNIAVSRVVASLTKKGELRKVQRGVFILADSPLDPELEAASVKNALAHRVMAR